MCGFWNTIQSNLFCSVCSLCWILPSDCFSLCGMRKWVPAARTICKTLKKPFEKTLWEHFERPLWETTSRPLLETKHFHWNKTWQNRLWYYSSRQTSQNLYNFCCVKHTLRQSILPFQESFHSLTSELHFLYLAYTWPRWYWNGSHVYFHTFKWSYSKACHIFQYVRHQPSMS